MLNEDTGVRWANYGNVRIGSKPRANEDTIDVVVYIAGRDGRGMNRLEFMGPDLVMIHKDESVMTDWEEEATFTYSPAFDDTMRDIFFALAKMYGFSEDAEKALKQGQMEGENRVLWQWVKSCNPTMSVGKKPAVTYTANPDSSPNATLSWTSLISNAPS